MLHNKNIQFDLYQPLLAEVKRYEKGAIIILINIVCADDVLNNN